MSVFDRSDFLTALFSIVDALNALDIPYYVGGSVAGSLYGRFRSTNDVDVAVTLARAQVDALVERLQADFYIDADMVRSAIETASCFNVIHLSTMVKADIFVPEMTPFESSKWSRRRQHTIQRNDSQDQSIYVASIEDMILQKLNWFRMTGARSDRQWSDILGMLAVQGPAIDDVYLRHWATELEVLELLNQALGEASD